MSNYKMNITGDIGLSDYSDIYDYIDIVDIDDKFLIILNSFSEENLKILNSMLMDKNFVILNQGYDLEGNYLIKANKRLR